jgi:hypothetical protein
MHQMLMIRVSLADERFQRKGVSDMEEETERKLTQ